MDDKGQATKIKPRRGERTLDAVLIASGAALISVCAWITVPLGPVPFTMQTFAVFTVIGLLGGSKGALSVAVYLLTGLLGAPVFSSFGSGPAVLFGPTGGFLISFLFAALIFAVAGRTDKKIVRAAGFAAGLIAVYAFGAAWFMIWSKTAGRAVGLSDALSLCVLPFVIPDIVKLALAFAVSERIRAIRAVGRILID